MHPDRYTNQLMEAVLAERDRVMTRRGLLTKGALVGVASGAMALGMSSVLRGTASAQDDATPEAESEPFDPSQVEFEDDIAVLNYALTLEHLEYAFYRDGIGNFTFGTDGSGFSIDEQLAAIRDHEGAHVDTLTQVITDLGGEPVEEATYDFGYGTDPAVFLATAMALENTGVSAYDGAGAAIEDPGLLTAAGTIVAVEARHASYLTLLNDMIPFPASFESPLTPDQVLEIAGPFIVSQ
jgi:rubrerythrin